MFQPPDVERGANRDDEQVHDHRNDECTLAGLTLVAPSNVHP